MRTQLFDLFDSNQTLNGVNGNQFPTFLTFKLYLLFFICMYVCIMSKPRLKDLWSKNVFMHNTCIKTYNKTYNRFLSILSMLHLDNNDRTSYPLTEYILKFEIILVKIKRIILLLHYSLDF